jgi:hypothetical protein
MSKAEKLAAKILSGRSDRNFSFADLCYILSVLVLRRGQVAEAIESIIRRALLRSSMSSRETGKGSRTK